uniref:Uncharacterized protein n=1 Tax=Moniliophthora roreri TaxID=221103 RepID=A0A0W0G9C8_MONRR
MIQNITFPDLTSVHFATPIQPVVLYAFLDRHRHTLRSAQLTYPDKEDTQLDNERQEGGKFALKQLDGPAQIIMPLLSWVDAPFLSQLALSFSSGDAPDLVLSDVNNAWRPLNVDELHLDLTFYQKQDSVLKGLLTCFSDVVSLRLSTYFDLDLAELMCKNISSFRRLRVLVFNSTPDHAITRYTGDEHAMVIRLGTACPSLQTCQIWTCPIWKRVVDGVWVPGKDSIDAGIFMLEMLSRRHSLAVKRLLQHLDSYSQVVPEVTETIKHFQKADNPVDETVMKDLLRLGQKLGFWDYAEAFYFSFKYVPPQHRPALRPPVPQRTVSVADMFSNEFMQSVASQLEDFETGLFRPDGDINFERDFGQWFNHPDDIAGLEMSFTSVVNAV